MGGRTAVAALLAAAAASLAPRAAALGQAGCRCLKSAPEAWTKRFVTDSCQLNHAGSCVLPVDYGMRFCSAWDRNTDHCNTTKTTPLPPHCPLEWCYVNSSACTTGDAVASARAVPGASVVDTPHYSYSTCGNINNFARAPTGADRMPAMEVVELVSNYVTQMRLAIQYRFSQMQGSSADDSCSDYLDSCACGSCSPGTGSWQGAPGTGRQGYSVDFRRISVTHMGGKDRKSTTPQQQRAQCLSQQVELEFKRISRAEYGDRSRMGFLLYGDHLSGSMVSWPAFDFCPSEFDPRFRPWYVFPQTGPKDVVIMLDRSSSMRKHGRWAGARWAAQKVLGTFTHNADYANIVVFNENATAFDMSTLQPVTEASVQDMHRWLGALHPEGNTDYRKAFELVFGLLSRSRDRQRTSNCTQVVIFLTDGEESGSFNPDEVKAMNTVGAVVFAYSIGDRADKVLPWKIACGNRGLWYNVGDGDDISEAMLKYMHYFVVAAQQSVVRTRWIYYRDYTTATDLIVGCQPIINNSGQLPTLVGVACMDISIVISLKALVQKPDYASTNAYIQRRDNMCAKASQASLLSRAQLEMMRAAANPESPCHGSLLETVSLARRVRARWRSEVLALALLMLVRPP